MALTSTTASSAVAIADRQVVVTSATGFAAGNLVLIDKELCRVSKEYVSGTTIPLDMRGMDGTPQTAHPTACAVTTGLTTDFADPAQGTLGGNTYPSQVGRDVLSYSASGAITLPSGGRDMLAILNGTGALAMTLANPTRDMEGSRLLIAGNGKAAHTVTYTAGLGNGGATLDVGTAAAGNICAFELIALGGFWVYLGIPSATAAANAFTWA